MLKIDKISAMQEAAAALRSSGRTIALIPTLGALHAGHASLIRLAKEKGHAVVVSAFAIPSTKHLSSESKSLSQIMAWNGWTETVKWRGGKIGRKRSWHLMHARIDRFCTNPGLRQAPIESVWPPTQRPGWTREAPGLRTTR